jgi:radical SAM-linked protein
MRIRVTFKKTGRLIYIGNLDLLTIWERAARRADLHLAYSHGFHPQPKLQFAAPLPLGFSSSCELLDMWIDGDLECGPLISRLNAVLPSGIQVLAAESVADSVPALQAQVVSAEYEVTLREGMNLNDMEKRVDALLTAETLPRERRSKCYDLRPLIESAQVLKRADGTNYIRIKLKAKEGATGRPDEVLAALGFMRDDARIERTALVFPSAQSQSDHDCRGT